MDNEMQAARDRLATDVALWHDAAHEARSFALESAGQEVPEGRDERSLAFQAMMNRADNDYSKLGRDVVAHASRVAECIAHADAYRHAVNVLDGYARQGRAAALQAENKRLRAELHLARRLKSDADKASRELD